MGHHFLQHAHQPVFLGAVECRHFFQDIAQPMRINDDADLGLKAAPDGVVIRLDGDDLAQVHAIELHGRADRQAAQGLLEDQIGDLRRAVRRGQGGLLILGQFVRRILRRRLAGSARGSAEGHASGQDGGDRLRLQLEPVRTQRNVHAAGVPEACRRGDKTVVGGVDEEPQGDRLAVLAQLV
ncbi:hypothetical protein D3C87_1620620 [compost metagenome]